MATGNPKIAPTAYFTAQMWAHAGFPEAARFSTPTGRALLTAFRGLNFAAGWTFPPAVRGLLDSLRMRHHCYDAWIAQQSPDFVMELGAGLSARGLHNTKQRSGLVWIDLDLPNMIAVKRRRLGALSLPPGYHVVEGDLLAGDLAPFLPVRPAPGQRVVAMSEGVTEYLAKPERKEAFSAVARLLRSFGGGRYLVDTYPAERMRDRQSGNRLAIEVLSRVSGTALEERSFERTEEAEAMLREAGFDEVVRVDPNALHPSATPLPVEARLFDLLEARVLA